MRTPAILLGLFLSSTWLCAADFPSGGAARLLRSTSLREKASATSKSLGRLPRNTVVLVKGEEKNGFVPVQVELEGNETIEGWLATEAMTTRSDEVTRETIDTEQDRKLAEDPADDS